MFTHVSLDSPQTQENRNTNCTILIFMVRKPVQKAKQFAQVCTYSKWQVWAFTLALQFQKQNHSTWPWVLCLAICITYTWISSRDKPEDTSILKNRDLKRNTTPLEAPWARSISINFKSKTKYSDRWNLRERQWHENNSQNRIWKR